MAVVLFGRPYNAFAGEGNKGIPAKFASRGYRIIPFDMQQAFSSIADHNGVKFKVSDHRPIWLRLRIDGPDDD